LPWHEPAFLEQVSAMLKVMIAEDDLLTADVLEDVLIGNGYDVCGVARTVEEGITLGQLCKPDLALLDLRLADGGLGTDIAAKLDFPGRPGILYATGNGNQILLTTADGEAVLGKPYRTEDVVRALQIVEQIVKTGKASPPFPGGFQVLPPVHDGEPAPAASHRGGADDIPWLLAQQAAFAGFAGFAHGESDLGRMLNDGARACAEMMGVPFCRIWRYRGEEKDLLMEGGAGWERGVVRSTIPMADAHSLQVRAFSTGKPTLCADLTKDKEFVFSADRAGHEIVSTLMVLIIGKAGQQWGLLEIGDQRPQAYVEYDIAFMNGFADVLSEVVSPSSKLNAALQAKIEEMSGFIADRLHLSADKQRAATAKNLALKERLIVTQELQHRVRNNLQMVYGMLIGQLRTATEPSVKEGIAAVSRCVITLGRVYDHLMGTGIGEKIDFGSYLSSLCSSFAAMEDPQQPKVLLTCQTTKVMLDLDTVTALGLIVAELISNSYQHAFPHGKGAISVSLLVNRSCDEGTLVFSDDGVGFDDIADGDKRAGLGMVRRLVKQINGSADHQSGAGSVWTVRFTLPAGATNDDETAGDTVPVARLLGSDLPVLDQATLGRTSKLLKPGAIVIHLSALATKCAGLLRGLHASGAFTGSDSTLADTAHQLAGNCGVLGFERLAYVARLFEDAARIAPAKAAALTEDIAAALEVTIKEIEAGAAIGLEARSDALAVS